MKIQVAIVALACLVVSASACVPPNCDHVDYGTCGNACCNVSFVASINSDAAARVLLKTLSNGGPDGRYKLSMTAEGTLGFANFTDYNMPINFLGQAIHHTKVHHYNDTINIAIAARNGNTSVYVTAFSISQIAGAYGDAGENFKEIISIFQASGVAWKYKVETGCPAPANPEPVEGLTLRTDADDEALARAGQLAAEATKAATAAFAQGVAAATPPVTVPEVDPQPESLHAECRLWWTVSDSCSDASSQISGAVKKMSGLSNCVGEKCGYTLESVNATYLSAYHVTPVHHYRDDITMTFTQSGSSCQVDAFSTSTIWYAVLDDGTNYCNLRNLIEATDLTFTQKIDTSDCTQYSTANCAKY